jgi:glycine/D-amino acid oxidase-like deaminating enzyme
LRLSEIESPVKNISTHPSLEPRVSRIAIVGAGFVGSTTAYGLMMSGMAAEIVLIDRDGYRAEGQVNDLRDAEAFSHTTRILVGDFSDKERLTDFFRETRELHPDYFLQADQTFVSGEHVITQWTLQVTITEPSYAGLTRRIPISIAGVSIVRTDNGKIADWADYYDGLTSRRTALAGTLYGMNRILNWGSCRLGTSPLAIGKSGMMPAQ